MTDCRAFAPAKINLTLHVTGQREDGYHLLDSLVVFAEVGDWVSVCAGAVEFDDYRATSSRFACSGDNLVLRAARAMGVHGLH